MLACVILERRVLLTPQFCFIGCFLPEAIYALFYVNAWKLDFSVETMFVLFGGVFLFFIFSFSIEYPLGRIKFKSSLRKNKDINGHSVILNKIDVDQWKLIILLIIQLVVLAYVVRFIMENYAGLALVNKMKSLNYINKFGDTDEQISLPRVLSWARTFSTSSCYVTGYMLVHSIIMHYKQHRVLLVVNILLSLINIGLNGGRFPLVGFFIALIAQGYFIWGKASNWNKKLKPKAIFKILLVFILMICLFQAFGNLLGRENTENFSTYLARYLSSHLKNLDTYIREGNFGCNIENWQTLIMIVNYLGRKLNIPAWIHMYDQPFRFINGESLGNTYTVFYWFLHDGGYIGVIVFLFIEALISQCLYQKAAYGREKSEISISIILYSYAVYTLVFSFFCERFFKEFINMGMVQRIVCWLLLRYFFMNVHLKNKNHVLQ